MASLILGGARSGKSALAEQTARQSEREVVVIVTADYVQSRQDPEMKARIAKHQADRPLHWQTVEAPLDLAGAINTWAAPHRHLIVDCLTLWLSNHLLAENHESETNISELSPAAIAARTALLTCLPTLPGSITLVSNEVGHGIVPLGALNRLYVDENGRLNQAVAAVCNEVIFTIAGCALRMKG